MSLTKLPGFTLDTTSNVTFANLTVTGNLTSGNANLGNAASANYFIGNGSLLTGLPAGYANSNVASYLPTYTGNLTAGNANLGNATTSNYFIGNGSLLTGIISSYSNSNVASYLPTYTGNVTGNYFIGNGSTLTSITGANITGNAPYAGTANYANTANSITGTNVSGNVSSAIQAHYSNIANSVAGSNISGQVGNALLAGTVYTNAQPNITSVGTLTSLSVTGDISGSNLVLTGNLTVSGTTTYVNSTITDIKDPIIELGGGTNAAALTTNDSKDRGTTLHYYTTAPVDAFMGWKNSGSEFIFASNATVSSDVVTVNTYGNVHANYYIGNGSQLTGIQSAVSAGYIQSGTSNVNIPTSSGNVTVGVGGTNNVAVVTSTGITVAGSITATGNVSAGSNYVLGNGFYLTGVDTAGRISSGTSNVGIPTASGNVTVGVGGISNVIVATTTGVNISGTLNIGSGAFVTTGNITGANANLGNAVTANYILGNGYYLTGISGATSVVNGTSNIIVNLNSNISMSVAGTANVVVLNSAGANIAGTLTTTGNISVGSNYFVGNGYYLTGLDAAGRVVNGTSNLSIASSGGNITLSVGGVGNVVTITTTGIVIPGSGTIFANSGIISAGTLYGTLGTANQYNVTHLGTLDTLTVTGNTSVGNLTTNGSIYANTGVVKGQYLYGDGSNLTGLGGAGYIFNGLSNVYIPTASSNVYFTIGTNANVMVVTGTGANIVGYANITGNVVVGGNLNAGNANLGNSVTANYFTGNLYGTANNAGTVTTNAQPNITSVGTLSSLAVSGTTNLGGIGNVTITGGASGYFLKTDGSGGLSWAVPAGGGGGGTSLTYTADTTPPATGNVLGDQWYNTTSSVLYEYISDGTASYWVDISSTTTTISAPTTLDLGNVTISGGTSGQALISNGAGGLSFTDLTQANIYNGNSNVTVTANSNVAFNITGVSNVLKVTSTGANLISTGTANLGNLVTANYFAGTLTTGAQPNITSVGTLTNLTVSGVTSYGLSADTLLTKTGATGTVNHDVTTGALFYHTSPAANFVVNLTNVPTTDGKVYMITLLISQGATPYIPSALWIDSYVQTVKWVTGVAAVGTASKTDVISYSLMRTGGAWIVFGQSTYYG